MGSCKTSTLPAIQKTPWNEPFLKGSSPKFYPEFRPLLWILAKKKQDFFIFQKLIGIWLLKKSANTPNLMMKRAPAPRISRDQIDISKIFKEGDQILVQVSKEPVYEKGAKLSTCFTLPGRFIVLNAQYSAHWHF